VPVALTLSSQKGFQMSGDDSIERVVFWIARPIRGIENHEGIAGCKPRRNASGNSISEIQGVQDGKVRFQRDNRVALVMTLPTLVPFWAAGWGLPD
jgi:hypothetical protein